MAGRLHTHHGREATYTPREAYVPLSHAPREAYVPLSHAPRRAIYLPNAPRRARYLPNAPREARVGSIHTLGGYIPPIPPWVYPRISHHPCCARLYPVVRAVPGEEALGSKKEGFPG